MKEQIRQLLEPRDFQPFTILMNDGERYRVPSRDHAFVGPARGTFIIVLNDKNLATFLTVRNISGVQTTDQSATTDLQPS